MTNQRHALPTDLLFLRHGETEANVQGILQGNSDTALTNAGRWQAQRAALRLAAWAPPICQIYCSPLGRARQTAAIVAQELGAVPVVWSDLREMHLGVAEGLTIEAFRQSYPTAEAQRANRDDLAYTWPGGEQRLAFAQRVRQAALEIAALHPGETVLLVTHGGVISAGVAALLGEEKRRPVADNTSLSLMRVWPDGRAELITWNDASHLDD
ncbi:MAG: histidine phosphatase family protein [Chloroflexi bacterium]|nr:histidine phosphatase family protein [Chloroflexota bacterium]